jgi:hypothetical protein
MRSFVLVMVAALLVCGTAFAGQNPGIRVYLTMDQADTVFAANPAPNSVQNVYLCFDNFGPGGGITAFSMILDFQCGGFVAGSADITLFGAHAQTVIGGPDNITVGWVVAVPDNECKQPDGTGVACVAMIPWFYTGPPGDIVFLPNPVDGKATVDCDLLHHYIDIFCVRSNGALGQEVQTPGDEHCVITGVEAETWGAIKALYR